MIILTAVLLGAACFLLGFVILEAVEQFDRKSLERTKKQAQGLDASFSLSRIFARVPLYHSGLKLARYRKFFDGQVALARLTEQLNFEQFLVIKELSALFVFIALWTVAADILGGWLCLLIALAGFWLPDLWLPARCRH